MTLIVTVTGRESLWMLADRRLSLDGRALRDDARKVMFLETTDGVAILGYAGLGATAAGTEPSDWMSAVLRGRSLPLEQSLGVIAEAMKKQLPRHMAMLPGPEVPSHSVLAAAILDNDIRLYTIDMVLAQDRKSYQFRYTRHVAGAPARTPRIGLAGSGSGYLLRHKEWVRPLLRVVAAYDRGRLTPREVADHLAKLNSDVHAGVIDNSVGPRCIVAWRPRRNGSHKGGGGHQFYSGTLRDANTSSLPTIANGMDVHALLGAMMPHMIENLDAVRAGRPSEEMDRDEVNAALARLPDKPDEDLK